MMLLPLSELEKGLKAYILHINDHQVYVQSLMKLNRTGQNDPAVVQEYEHHMSGANIFLFHDMIRNIQVPELEVI
jgi:hypothetical protein